jgi:hypothetical protein
MKFARFARLSRFARPLTAGLGRLARRPRTQPSVELLEDRLVPSTLIPVTGHRGLVYDGYRNVLDITTSNGTVQQFNVMTQSLSAPIPLGTNLAGADISNDGNYLLVAEQQTLGGQEVLHRFNLNTGARTDFYLPSGPGEGGWSLALGLGTKGLLDDTVPNNSGGPMRYFDDVTGTQTFRNDVPTGGVGSGTIIQRSANRSLFLISEGGQQSGELFTYNPQTDKFSNPYFVAGPGTTVLTAVNRNGTLIAAEVNGRTTIFDSNFNVKTTLPPLDGGLVFDPSQDLLWGVTSQGNQLLAIDTNTWQIRYSMPVGEAFTPGTPLGNGTMAMSTDGRFVFLATPSGVREFPSPFAPGPVAYLSIGNVPATAAAGTPIAVTVSALDSSGRVATGYVGTVDWMSSDPRATLPADYSFTPSDLGTHTFYVTLGTVGAQVLNVYDPHGPGGPQSPPIQVVPGAVASFQLTPSSSGSQTSSGGIPEAVGYAFGLTVTPLDAYGNIATNYTGTVHFTSTDAAASLPHDYAFTPNDHGRHGFSVTLNTAGSQTVTVSDITKPPPPPPAQPAKSSISFNAVNYIPGLYFTLSPSTTTPTAGVPLSLTVTAWDQYNSVATRYIGTVTFTTSDPGTGAFVAADYTFTAADKGVHTFTNGFQFVTAGAQSIGIRDKAYVSGQTATSTKVTVSPAAASTLRLGGFPTSVTAGGSGTATVTAYDAYGNVATGYSGTVHFTSSDGQAALPADATLTNGTGAFSVTLETAGTQSLTATDTANAALTSTEGGITVSPAAASTLQVTGFPSAVTAGDTDAFAVTAYDAYGNVATGYAGTVHVTSSDGQAILPADATLTNGTGSFSAALKTAGTQSLTATDTASATVTGTETGISVSPAAASVLQVTGFPSAVTAGDTDTFAVTAYDAYGNVATGYAGTVHFTSSDGQAVLPADTSLTAGSGTFTATLKTAGGQSLTATDTANSALSATEGGITVSPAAASVLVLSAPATATAGVPVTVTLTAYDAYGNVATGYLGTVSFSSSDASASLPADYTFTAADAGSHSFSVTFLTLGSQSLTVSDTADGLSTTLGIVVQPA